MELNTKYPEINDLRRAAKRRLPKFVWEYLDSGTGTETTAARNRTALDRIGFAPSILHGEIDVDLSTSFLGQDHPLPVGFAPVGMSGLIWPGRSGFWPPPPPKRAFPFACRPWPARRPKTWHRISAIMAGSSFTRPAMSKFARILWLVLAMLGSRCWC